MAGSLLEQRVLTMAELLRRGPEEIGQLCGLKLGPNMKFVKVVKRLSAAAVHEGEAVRERAAVNAPPYAAPPAAAVVEQIPAVVSAELHAVCHQLVSRHLRLIRPSF
jgi:hypothetical protein